jgi:lipopolysaccharide/colanic/teichoic acid biosynthesis glycosyltransferase
MGSAVPHVSKTRRSVGSARKSSPEQHEHVASHSAERAILREVVPFADRPSTETRCDTGGLAVALRRAVEPQARHEPLNRAINVMIAAAALVVLAPLFLCIALLVLLTSRGPILYTQVRVGVDRRRRGAPGQPERRSHDLGGQPFTMYKFRTMHVDAEPDGHAVWAKANDHRVTRLGRVLRRTRLDELPQFFNVLTGDMNIVGPRPERPAIFATLRAHIPEYPNRQRVKPGITGLAQINHTYDACVDDVRTKVAYDLEYIQRQGLVEDLRIMSLTVPVMLGQRKGW